MRPASARDRAAAMFFGLIAASAGVAAVVTASVVMLAVGIVLAVAAVAALRRYPIDPNW